MTRYGLIVSCLAWMGLIQGCTTWTDVPFEQAHIKVRVGDTVRATRSDGFRKSFEVVTPVEDGTIRGKHDEVSLGEITRLEKRTVKKEAVGVGVTILAAITVIILSATTDVFW